MIFAMLFTVSAAIVHRQVGGSPIHIVVPILLVLQPTLPRLQSTGRRRPEHRASTIPCPHDGASRGREC